MNEEEKISLELQLEYDKAIEDLRNFQNQIKKSFSSANINVKQFDQAAKSINNMNNSLSSMQKELNKVNKSVNDTINNIKRSNKEMASIGNNMGIALSNGITKGLSQLKNLGNVIVNLFKSAKSQLSSIGREYGMSISNGINRSSSMFKNIGKNMSKMLSDGFSHSFNSIGKIIGKSIGNFSSLSKTIITVTGLLYKLGSAMDDGRISKSLRNVNDQIKANTQSMNDYLKKTVEYTTSTITNTAKVISNLKSFPSNFKNNFSGIKTSIVSSFNEAKKIISGDNSINIKIKGEGTDIKDALRSVDNLITNTKNKLHSLANIIPNIKASLSIGLSNSINKDISSISKYLSNAQKSIDNFRKSASTLDKTKNVFSALGNIATAGLIKLGSILKQFVITKFLKPKDVESQSKKLSEYFPGGIKVIGLFKASFNNLIKLTTRMASTLAKTIGSLKNVVTSTFNKVITTLNNSAKRFLSVFKYLETGVRKSISTIGGIIRNLFGSIKSVFSSAGNLVIRVQNDTTSSNSLFSPSLLANTIKNATNQIASGKSPQLGYATSAITSQLYSAGYRLKEFGLLASQVYYLVKSNWGKIAQFGTQIFTTLKSSLSGITEPLKNVFVSIKANLVNSLSTLFSNISGIGGNVFSSLISGISRIGELFTSLINFIGGLLPIFGNLGNVLISFGSALANIGSLLLNTFRPAIDAIILGFKSLVQIVSPLLNSLQPVITLFVTLSKTISLLIQSVTTFASGLLTGPLKMLVSGVSSVVNMLSKAITNVLHRINAACEKFVNFANKLFHTKSNKSNEDLNSNVKNTYDINAEVKKFGESINKMNREINNVETDSESSSKLLYEFDRAILSATERMQNFGKDKSGTSSNKFNNPFTNMKNPFENVKNPFEGVNNPFANINMDNLKNGFVSVGRTMDSILSKTGKYSMLVNSIRHPFQALKAEIAKKGLESIYNSAKKTVTSFNELRSALNRFNNASSGVNKIKASFDVLRKGVKTAFNAIATQLKSYALDKLINKMKKPTEKASKDLASCMPGGSRTIGLFKAALSKLTALFGVYQIYNLIKNSITSAMNAVESENLFEVSMANNASASSKFSRQFGITADDIVNNTDKYVEAQKAYQHEMKNNLDAANEFKEALQEIYGFNSTTINNMMGSFSNLANGIGMTTGATLQMSKGLTMLSEDMASFFNKNEADVAQDLQAIFTSQYETLRKYGIVLNETILKQNAHRFGIEVTDDALTQTQKSLIAYNMVLEKTRNAQGDLSRTMESPANAVRRLKEEFKTLATAIGNIFLPIIQVVVPVIENVVKRITVLANQMAIMTQKLLSPFVKKNKDTSQADAINKDAYQTIDANNAIGESYDLMGGSAEDYGNTAEKSANKAKKAMQNSLASFDEINTITRDQSTEDDSSSILDSISTDPAANFSYDFGLEGLEEASQELEETNEALLGFIDKAIAPFKAAWENMDTWFLAKIEGWKAAFANMSESIKNFLMDIYNSGGAEVIQHIAELAIAIVGTFIGMQANIMNCIAEIANYLSPSNNPITKNLIEAFDGLIVAVKDFIMGLSEGFQQLWDNGLGDLVKTIIDTVNVAATAFMNIGSTIITACGEILEYLNPVNNEFTAVFLDKVAAAIKSIQGLFNILSDGFSYLMEHGLKQALKILGDVIMILGGTLFDVLKVIIDAVKKFADSWLFEAVLSVVGGLLEGIAWILKGLAKVIETVVGWILKFFEAIIDWFIGGLDSMKGCVEGVKEAFSGLINWFKELPEKFVTLGKNIIKGLTKGIKSLVTKPVEAVKNVGKKVINGFKNLFNINSPSKVFEEFGQYTMEGFSMGINNQKDVVISDVDKMSTSIIDNANSSFNNLATSMTSPFEQVIAELYKMTKNINDMFDFEVNANLNSNISTDKILSVTSQTSRSLSRAAAQLDANEALSDESLNANNISNIANVSANFDYDRLARAILSSTDKEVIIQLDKRELGRGTINAINEDTKINGKCRIRR